MSTRSTSGGHLLTVLHAAERSGPSLLALHFLRWMRAHHPEWTTSTLLIDPDGGLDDEFAELGRVVVAGPGFPFAPGRSLVHRAVTGRRVASVRRRLAELGPVDVSHVHCAGSMRLAPALPDAPVLCHVHEMAVGLELHLGPLARAHLETADRYVVVSEAVRSALLARFAVDPSTISRHYEFVAPVATTAGVPRTDNGTENTRATSLGSGTGEKSPCTHATKGVTRKPVKFAVQRRPSVMGAG